MNLYSLSKKQLKTILKGSYAKYLSQHDPKRHYIINYNLDNTFLIHTFNKNKYLGTGNGNYYILEKNNESLLNIQYKTIFPSPNIKSPMNPKNNFYPKLKNYTIGPFYTTIPPKPVKWLPVLYNHIQMEKGFKVLNFYKFFSHK